MTNTDTERNNVGRIKLILALLVGVGLVFFMVSLAVNERLSDLQLETKVLISEQETLLAAIAETTARNGADEITERIIKDCSLSERTQFDELLSNLNNGLNKSQLTELERLFGRCGNFFSERKSMMTSRLSREIEIYENYVNQLSNLSGEDKSEEYKVNEWKELSSLELKQSQLFSELVISQDQIISELLAGNSQSSEEITSILQNVGEIQQTLLVTKSQATSIRSGLVSL